MSFEHAHLVGGEGPEQIEREPFGFISVEPPVEVSGVKDDGLAGMDATHQFICESGDDGEGLEPVPFPVFPSVPEAGEGDGLAVGAFEAVGRLRWLSEFVVE